MNSITEKLKSFIDNGIDALDDEMLSELGAPETKQAPLKPEKPQRQACHIAAKSRLGRCLHLCSGVLLCAALISLMLLTVSRLPAFGHPDTLSHNEVSEFYVENGVKDTGAVNIVTSIILNYRGFDTLGESHVLFIAVCAVMILLRNSPTDRSTLLSAYANGDDKDEPHDDLILFAGGRIAVPLILMFGLYIILNGNISPGGGFSGGAVIGAGLILYLSIYGYPASSRFMNITTFRAVSASALMSYCAFKTYHFICGYNGLESVFTRGVPGSIFSGGMLLYLNIFVGAVVAMTMYALFTLFRKGDF